MLAVPIMIAQLSYAAMGFVDTVMAGQVSARDLAAVALGNSLWVPVFLLISAVKLPKLLSPEQVVAKWAARIPDLIAAATKEFD